MQQSEVSWRAKRRGRMCRRNCQSLHSKRRTDSCAAIDDQEGGAVLKCNAEYCIAHLSVVISKGTDLGG